MVVPPYQGPEEVLARRDPRLLLLIALGGLSFVAALSPAASFLAPALCVAAGAFGGAMLGQRAGLVLSLYAVALFVSAVGLTRGSVTDAFAVSATTLLAGIGLGRCTELRRRILRTRVHHEHTDEELVTLQRDHEALLRVVPDTVCTIDRAGTVMHSNGTPDAANNAPTAGRNLSELLPRGIASGALETLQEALSAQEPATFDFQLGSRDPRFFTARVVPSSAHDVLVLIRDISELKNVERALDAVKRDALSAAGTKGRFLAAMSHQIRTPMNGVIGMTNVLLQTRLTPEQREYTTIIRNSGEALLSILDDVLDYAKLEEGQIKLSQAPLALRELLDELSELLAARAHEKGLEIESIVDARVPAWVHGDRGRLRQVIINLLGNAIKFTERGHVVLRASVVGHERDTALIRFDVSDTGVGIPPDQQPRLFQDYGQAHPAIAREYGGTGLGLAISRQIVERMGGRMLLESEEGAGSTFSFTARFGVLQDRTTQSFVLPRALGGARLLSGPLHTLTRALLEHELVPLGAKLRVGDGPASFTEVCLQDGPFDAVLIELPLGTPEARATSLVSEAVKAAGDAPVVALCSLGQRSLSECARKAGASFVLTRPLRRKALYDGLVAVLGLTGRTQKPRDAGHLEAASDLHVRVLLAEDNLINQKVVARSLELLGCQVEVVENGALAVEAFKQRDFDAVLMDCQMPVMDGFEATRRLRELEQRRPGRTPVIAVTANAMQGDRERCLAAGMDDYVAKPVTLSAIDQVLRKWLPGKAARRPSGEEPGRPREPVDA